jgi:cytochrome P450
MPYRLFLGESDPPIHTERRRLESPFFTLKAVDRWRPALERHFLEALNEVIESGSADLVDDVTIPTTARTTLFVVGYDPDAWRAPAAVAHKSGYLTPDHPDYPRGEQEKMRREFRDMLTSRVGEPTTDIIAALANGIVEGRPLTLDEGESMMNALIFGGFDTTVSATCSSLIWFDRHRDEREAVFADPRRLNNAVDELLRLYPPVSHQARTAIRDTELLGQPIAAGERVLAWLAAANRDPAKYPDPDVVDLDRANAPTHFSFSGGPHRCLGSPLAKLEIAHMLKRLYELLPDLAIDHDGVERFPTAGGVAGFVRVPATFTPRERVPVPDPSE